MVNYKGEVSKIKFLETKGRILEKELKDTQKMQVYKLLT